MVHGSGCLDFFVTHPNPCPYLPDRLEQRVVTNMTNPLAAASHDILARAGFRRVQQFAYRPACPHCAACVPIRVNVDRFMLDPVVSPGTEPQPGSGDGLVRTGGHRRTVPAVQQLPAFTARGRRHAGHGVRRLRRHGVRDPDRDPDRRVSARRVGTTARCGPGRFPERRSVRSLQLLRRDPGPTAASAPTSSCR